MMAVIKDLKEMSNLVMHAKQFVTRPLNTKDSLGLRIQKTAARSPNALMCIFEDKTITWKEFNELSNQLASMLKSMGIKKGDVVSVLIENRIESMAATTALCKLGAISGLINTHLTGPALQHCIESVDARKIIIGEELLEPLKNILDNLNFGNAEDIIYIKDHGKLGCPDWATEFVPSEYGKINHEETLNVCLSDVAYYIFTSGTTGLPKASIITHERDHRATAGFAYANLKLKPSDRIYLCLPLYHSSAMFIGFGSIGHVGASMFLRRKFSARKFLEETRKYNTNCFVYIGEICRYLLHQKATPNDRNNPIVKCTGNGLRPDIWNEFKTRYNIERIAEFYGSSEGNLACMNLLNKDNTIGFCPTKHALVKYDILNDELVKDSNGHCVKVSKGETGLLLGKISATARFDGYVSKEASDKMLLKGVFEKGDTWFNSGDLLKQIDVGLALTLLPHYQFVDRVGDTYRWKGENVSTNEIGELLNSCDQIQYCNLYGVQIPGTDGRAGMAAIIPETADNPDIDSISSHIDEYIASYARPLFLRILAADDMDTTGTFKMKKGVLKEEAFHPDKVKDTLYVLKPGSKKYEKLDDQFYQEIMAGNSGF